MSTFAQIFLIMKKLVGFLSFIFSVVILFSCEPGRDESGDLLFGVNPPNQNEARLLKKMISHSQDEDSGDWEESSVTYNYTSNKLVSYTDGSGEATMLTYNNDKKISKLSSTAQTAVFQYIGENVSKITTTIAGVATINATYTFTGTKLTKSVSVQEYSLPMPMKLYMETSYEYTGANMTKAIIKNGVYLPGDGLEMIPGEQILTFTYDAKKSPYQLLPKEFITYLAGIAPHGAAFLSTNNFTKMSISDGATPVSTTYTYTYDKEDYPVEMKAGEEFIKYEYQ